MLSNFDPGHLIAARITTAFHRLILSPKWIKVRRFVIIFFDLLKIVSKYD